MSEAIQGRLLKVKELRESGMTYKQIGDAFGVSKTRAAQLYAKATRKQRIFSFPLYTDLYLGKGEESYIIRTHVSTRALNILQLLDVYTVEDLICLDIEGVKKVHYAGKKMVAEIEWFQKKVRT